MQRHNRIVVLPSLSLSPMLARFLSIVLYSLLVPPNSFEVCGGCLHFHAHAELKPLVYKSFMDPFNIRYIYWEMIDFSAFTFYILLDILDAIYRIYTIFFLSICTSEKLTSSVVQWFFYDIRRSYRSICVCISLHFVRFILSCPKLFWCHLVRVPLTWQRRYVCVCVAIYYCYAHDK